MRRQIFAAVALAAPLTVLVAGAAGAAPGDLQPFTMAGAPADGGFPGSSGAIDLQVTNPNDVPLTLTGLTVSIQSITQALGAVGLCTAGDFEISQLATTSGVVLPPTVTATLSGLGVAAGDLPRFAMLNSSLNQDGCKGASVTLLYTGTATADDEVGGVVRPEVPGTGTGGGTGGGGTAPGAVGGVDLPHTGADHTRDLVASGGVLTALGAAIVVAARRRRKRI